MPDGSKTTYHTQFGKSRRVSTQDTVLYSLSTMHDYCVFFPATAADWGERPISDTTMPRIQQLMLKKMILASHSPGTNVEFPRNSS